MTNIEKALEAYETPWRKERNKDLISFCIYDARNIPVVLKTYEDIADLIISAVNAYDPEKPCEACGGTGGIEYDAPIDDMGGRQTFCDPCPACKGTGKQPEEDEHPDTRDELLDEQYTQALRDIEKRDKVIRELEAACEESLEFIRGFHKTILRSTPMSATEVMSRHLKPKLKAALANAKGVMK